MKLRISEIASMIGAEVVNMTDDVVLNGVARDSHEIKPDELFVPLRGARFDGHDFIESVQEKGVRATLWGRGHRPLPEGMACIIVDNTLRALQDLARIYLERMGAKVVAVTGSNGKTSIKDMSHSVLATKYRCAKTPGNYNNDIGLPLSILSAPEDTEYMVLEMGMDHPGDIRRLVEIAPPDIAIIANVGTAHLQFFDTRENIAKGKLEIMSNMKPDALVIRNGEEPLLEIDYPNTKTFGLQAGHDIYPTGIRQDFEGIDFDTNLIRGVRLNTFGRVQVENAMAAILVGMAAGVEPFFIKEGLLQTPFTKNRNDLYPLGDVYVYDDSYKSNPEGLAQCLATMHLFPVRRIAVLADMAELGETAAALHRRVAYQLKENEIDRVYLYGALSRHTYETCLELGVDARYYEDKDAIVRDLFHEKDALILFKASNCMRVFDVLAQFRKVKGMDA